MCQLIQKYNVPGPRYTSYPTVPYWDTDAFSGRKWESTLLRSFHETNASEGISLYIHLPFCESLCTFCGCHKRITKRHEVELPYLASVVREWELYCDLFPKKPIIKELHLGGGTPTFFSPENLQWLIRGILQYANRAPDFEFSFEGHPNNTTREHLEALYEVGFDRVSYGIQDYNTGVQQAIHRIQPFENVKRATNEAREVGYKSVGHDLIFGLPFQTLDHIQETIRKTKELMPDRLAFYSYAHVPWLKGNGQRGFKDADLPTAEQKREQYEHGRKGLLDAGYAEIGLDHFALPDDGLFQAMQSGQLHRNFMGYTATKTSLMIGLGVSSISDSGYSFAQNVKGIEEYTHLVENDIIPVYRGHILTEEDRIIRAHILNLMCRFETSWKAPDHFFDGLDTLQDRIGEMVADGLAIVTDEGLWVTEKGRPFVRNICMALDMHWNRNKPSSRLFSMTV